MGTLGVEQFPSCISNHFLLDKVLQQFCNTIATNNNNKNMHQFGVAHEKDSIKQKDLSFQKDGQKRKVVIKIEFTHLPDCNILPLFKGFQIKLFKRFKKTTIFLPKKT